MATLYVENVPEDLYEALRAKARARRRSIAAEILALLEEIYPTEKELIARHALFRKLERMRAKKPRSRRMIPTEELQREDRRR
jgi:plasmid stability protein